MSSIMSLPVQVKGHAKITDDLGNVLLNKDNAVHPQNMARVIARALAKEDNYFIHRVAFGNGGSTVDVAYTVNYKTPNDGQPPDTNTWNSTIYSETYSEVVNESDTRLGTDPGSAGRPGGGSSQVDDPLSVEHVSGPGVRSNELGLTSEVVVTVVLNANEPFTQSVNDYEGPDATNTESTFTFDEIGLYTTGSPLVATSGTQDVDVGTKVATDDTGLVAGTTYDFSIQVDGGTVNAVTLTTPAGGGSGTGGEILFGDLVAALLTSDAAWSIIVNGTPATPGSPFIAGATVNINNDGTFDPAVPAAVTYGFLRFTSTSSGATSSVALTAGTTNDLFGALNPPTGGIILTAKAGSDAGVANMPTDSATEAERLLAHLVFSPILKSANRVLTITYTLTVSVARSWTP
jgi:hypothetical protein